MSWQCALVNNTPSTWVAAPAPTDFAVLTDTPFAGIDREKWLCQESRAILGAHRGSLIGGAERYGKSRVEGAANDLRQT